MISSGVWDRSVGPYRGEPEIPGAGASFALVPAEVQSVEPVSKRR